MLHGVELRVQDFVSSLSAILLTPVSVRSWPFQADHGEFRVSRMECNVPLSYPKAPVT